MKMILAVIAFMFLVVSAYADMYQSVTNDGAVLYTNLPSSGSKIILKEKKQAKNNAARISGKKGHYSNEFSGIAEEKAKKHNLDPKLVKAVIRAESNWNPSAVSNKGAVGMMQLMPKTANDMGVGNPLNPEENIEGGTKYLRYLLDKFNGNLTLAVAAYNAGPARVEKVNGVPAIPETISYVNRVMTDYSGGNGPLLSIVTKIHMVVQKDGSVLFTNAYNSGRSYLNN